jgi:hypothetical protein
MLFLVFAIYSNPGWVKYPDSLYYLEIARSWSQFKFVLDDGTGAFVRPFAYLIYGIGYWLGGFSGIHLLNTALVFIAAKFAFKKWPDSVAICLIFAFYTSPSFAIYANSILLQTIGFGYMLFILSVCKLSEGSYSEAFKLNLLLIFGVFIHGGVLFLWLSYLAALILLNFSIYRERPAHQLLLNAGKSFLLFLVLIATLCIFEAVFSEKVFKSFLAEKGFSNRPELYYFGKFFIVYFEKIIKDLGILGWIVLFLFIYSSILNINKIRKGSQLEVYSTWMIFYLLIFEVFTSTGIMKRDPTASEYYRTYFMSYPLLILSTVSSSKILLSNLRSLLLKINLKFVGKVLVILKSALVFLILYVLYENSSTLKKRFDLSPYAQTQQILLNVNQLPRSETILLVPSNIYVHRRFFTDKEFLGDRAKYYFDICKENSFQDAVQRFDNVFIVKYKSLIDKRIDRSLLDASKNCDPNINYFEILKSNGYSEVAESNYGTLLRKNEKN